MEQLLVRHADTGDIAAITDIYNHYIRSSTATFDTEEKSEADRERWLLERSEKHPVIVAVNGDRVVGWAALTPWSARPAWAGTAEVAVYLQHGATGRGVGSLLLGAMIREARARGLHSLVSQVVGGNTASLRMAERAGFRRVGLLMQVGWKFDRWLDVVLLQLVLDEG